ncbi:hypothetical protein QR680_009609 [Steinernema hermaphroditum]|uniref:Uncharacterized protein n=1 Tax=Steinernema hermaphroditum TaxID=289476 RepID=A0AA39IMQ8_9BILA|nr:hypothetical protein QR680_009609 [Steinernema hermaphroditum]
MALRTPLKVAYGNNEHVDPQQSAVLYASAEVPDSLDHSDASSGFHVRNAAGVAASPAALISASLTKSVVDDSSASLRDGVASLFHSNFAYLERRLREAKTQSAQSGRDYDAQNPEEGKLERRPFPRRLKEDLRNKNLKNMAATVLRGADDRSILRNPR